MPGWRSGYRSATSPAAIAPSGASRSESLDLHDVVSQGYCFQIDMLWHAHRAGLHIAEVPITFVERRFGDSKMSSDIVREAILRVTMWGLLAMPERLWTWMHGGQPTSIREHAHVS